MHKPTSSQAAVLGLVAVSGGYIDDVVDPAAAEQCVDRDWLVHEGEAGYALTIEGAREVRRSSFPSYMGSSATQCDEYLGNAEEMRAMAASARKPEIREQFLALAKSWEASVERGDG